MLILLSVIQSIGGHGTFKRLIIIIDKSYVISFSRTKNETIPMDKLVEYMNDHQVFISQTYLYVQRKEDRFTCKDMLGFTEILKCKFSKKKLGKLCFNFLNRQVRKP